MQDEFNWANVDPIGIDPEQQARAASQVRIMFASGKSRIDVQVWLEEFGITPEQAVEFLEDVAPLSHQRWSMAQLGAAIGAGVAGFLSLAVTLVYRPWNAEWVVIGARAQPLREVPVHSSVGVLYWILGLLAFVIVCGSLGAMFGQIVHWLRRGDRL